MNHFISGVHVQSMHFCLLLLHFFLFSNTIKIIVSVLSVLSICLAQRMFAFADQSK